MQGIRSKVRLAVLAVLTLAGVALTSPALADDVVVTRHVTVRAAPSSKAAVVVFPDVGDTLTLLDDGNQRNGYYHVSLGDGREGWVYRTFVHRVATAAQSERLLPGSTRISVHYIDVDQGNAALVEFPCGDILIDAGGRGAAASQHLISYLDAFFARRPDLHRHIDTIFVTHTHIDHNTNLREVAEHYSVGAYVHNGRMNGSGRVGASWMTTRAGAVTPPIRTLAIDDADVAAQGDRGLTNSVIDSVACPGVDPRIEVLSGGHATNPGWSAADFDNGNNHSLVIRVDYGRSSFLFSGDLEETAIGDLLRRYAGTSMLDADVYEVGHHGSANGTTQAFLDAITPQVAVISMGHSDSHDPWTAWAYGHPRRAIVSMLQNGVSSPRAPAEVLVADGVHSFSTFHLTKAVYATGWDGDVTVSADAQEHFTVTVGQ